jgi:hypothetical protein
MYRRKRGASRTRKHLVGLLPNQYDATRPIKEVLKLVLDHERDTGDLDTTSIDSYGSRTIGEKQDGVGVLAFLAAGIKTAGDFNHSALKLTAKHVDAVTGTPARYNGIISALKRFIATGNSLGLLKVTDPDLRAMKLKNAAPPEPEQMTDEQVHLVKHSIRGKDKYEILQNEIIAELELDRAVRPATEICGIDDENVHPDQNYFELIRDDGALHRLYTRRDLSEKMARLKVMRRTKLKGKATSVKAFFTFSKPRKIDGDLDLKYRLTPEELRKRHNRFRQEAAPKLDSVTQYTYRHQGVSNHHERAEDLGIWPRQTSYEDNHDPDTSIGFYKRRQREEREFLDRSPEELVPFCKGWIGECLKDLVIQRDPAYLFELLAWGIPLGLTMRRLRLRRYREYKSNLPDPQSLRIFTDKLLSLILKTGIVPKKPCRPAVENDETGEEGRI